MSDFRNGAEFQALMVALSRIESVNQVAFEAAQASERTPQDHYERRRLEQENMILGRQLRSALLCSAYSIAEAVIIGLAPKVTGKHHELAPKIRQAYRIPKEEKLSQLHTSQYQLQYVADVCKGDDWDDVWSRMHRLRKLRNKLIHGGGIGAEDKLSKKVDNDDVFRAWVEPMFEHSEVPIFVLVIKEFHFRGWLQRLQKIILDIDSELSKVVTGN